MKPFDKNETGELIAAIHSLGKDKVRELALLMWERIKELETTNPPETPDGWVMVPKEPTESMIIDGFESEPDKFFSDKAEWKAYKAMSGCQQAAHRAKLCWAAMLAAAPKPEK
ncbi:hypothetical protein [Serratia liquefaciens]|uniref:hypothetical protein n=1 Tax=Serratia liquefaciens TaxID=614 RepID=UPI00061B893A|nr:hypothetical protein [Serratia liquefaciens]AKE09191.1 hypothetical protein XJ20_04530 [Serratia liquefaciens]